jgi:hypothetical protein
VSETTRDALLKCFHQLVTAGAHPPTLLTFAMDDYRRIARDCDCEGALFIVMAHDYGRTTIRPEETPPRSAKRTEN